MAGWFTGWTDVGLTGKGIQEAREADRTLQRGGYAFDAAYTSVLKRAIKRLWLVLEEMDLMWIPVHRSWRLDERHYGALQAGAALLVFILPGILLDCAALTAGGLKGIIVK